MTENYESKAIKEYIISLIKKAQVDIYSNSKRFGSPVEPEEIIEWIENLDSEYVLNIFYPVLKHE
jgi:hypothetical protein